MPGRHAPAHERFWRHVNINNEGCWEWAASTFNGGYGQFKPMPGQPPVRASRYSWELHHGPIPDGLMVLHQCDNPPCVRPDHLFVGTGSDNMADCTAKGRHPATRPESAFRLARRKLTDQQVREIRAAYDNNTGSIREIGRQYGVDGTTVLRIGKRRTFRHLP
jgi:hypothetical protein